MDTISNEIKIEIKKIKNNGLYKKERIIESSQNSEIIVDSKKVINFCANNYLGLANNKEIINAAKASLDRWGFGLSSVRFICGTQSIHKDLEKKLSRFLEKDDTILYTSCFDANGGLYETLLNSRDAIISDSLNHASIIDGVRLCKAERFRYENSNMNQLEDVLKNTTNYNNRLITTDGVFSMDGYVAKLDDICYLAEKYNALVHVDDSHATGFFGENGKGSIEYCNVIDKVDIITSTLGKAMGGASGGFTSGKQNIINLLRQRSRPYLFSNSLAPSIVSASIVAIDIITKSKEKINTLKKNTSLFRKQIEKSGLKIKKGVHPIVPIMIGDAEIAQKIAEKMLEKNIYVVGFSYPVVPHNEARIRVQISASHTKEQINDCVDSFADIAKNYGIL